MYLAIGVGQCGCGLVDALFSSAGKEIRMLCMPVAINTAAADLVRLKKIPPDFWLGIGKSGKIKTGREKGFVGEITGGIGADFNKGQEIFEDAKAGIIEKLMMRAGEEEISFAMLFWGLGGGTGSSGAPVVAEALKGMGIPTIGVGVLPADSEGDKRAWNAYNSLKHCLKLMDGVLLADNGIIDRKRGLSGMYHLLNRYIVGCMSDFILGPFAEGIGTKQEGLTFDYRDFITSLNIGKERGIGVLGRYTQSLGFFSLDEKFGWTKIEPKEFVKNALNQLSVGVEESIGNIYKMACVSTIHPSLKGIFPYQELQDYLTDLTKMNEAHVGTNETKRRMARITLSITYDPEDISRLWIAKDRVKRYEGEEEEILRIRAERGGERLFE
jgi:hypothetical protein